MSGPITKMDLGHTGELHLANSKKGFSGTDRTKHLRALTYWVTFKKLARDWQDGHVLNYNAFL